MASIEKTKNNDGWIVRYRDRLVVANEDGTVSKTWVDRSRKCPDKRTAEALQRDVEQERAQGRNWVPADDVAQATLERVSEAYLKEKSKAWRGKTTLTNASHLDVFLRWARVHTGKPVIVTSFLTKQVLIDYAGWLALPGNAQRKRTRAKGTVSAMVFSVEQMWAWAANDDQFVDMVGRPRTVDLGKVPKNPVEAPTWAEMDACIAALGDTALARLCIVLRYTGLRSSQAMALEWDDFDLHAGTMTVRGEIGKSNHEILGRTIPITAFLLEELKRWKAAGQVWDPGWQRRGKWVPGREKWVVPGHNPRDSRSRQGGHPGARKGAHHREPNTHAMHLPWIVAGVKPSIWKKHVHHCFRSGFTSNTKRDGADPEAVEWLVGHAIEGSRGAYLDPDFMPLRHAVSTVPEIGSRTDGVHRLRAHQTATEGHDEDMGVRVASKYADVQAARHRYLRDAGARGEGMEVGGSDLSLVEMDGDELGSQMRWSPERAVGFPGYLHGMRLALGISLDEAALRIGGASHHKVGFWENTPLTRAPRMAILRQFSVGYERDIREVVLAAGYAADADGQVITYAAAGDRPAWSRATGGGFGAFVRALRVERGLSARAVAALAGTTFSTVLRTEERLAERPPKVTLVCGLAQAFGIDIGDMMVAAGFVVEIPRRATPLTLHDGGASAAGGHRIRS